MNMFKVPIKNVLYMYSYIWDKVDNKNFINLNSNDNFYSSNIYAELFLMNINSIIKKGLYKEYINKNEEIKGIKGKIDFKNSLSNLSFPNSKSYCYYDEMEPNNIYNQILKAVAVKLYKSNDLREEYRKRLNDVILYFHQIDFIELTNQDFKKVKYNKSNLYYYYILKICELINNCLMLNEETGEYEFINLFEDEKNMHNIFELFVNKFYSYELNKKFKVYFQKQLYWDLVDGNIDLLPIMKLDTMIESDIETIILDTKYYKEYYSTNEYGGKKIRSEHLYQIMSYMNNAKTKTKLRGILLYPMPYNGDEINEKYVAHVVSEKEIVPANIEIITIDLSKEWQEIKTKLLNII